MAGEDQGEPVFLSSVLRDWFSPVSIFAICHLLLSVWLLPKQIPQVWSVASS